MPARKCVLCGHELGWKNRTGICAACLYGGNDAIPLPLSEREKQILQLLADGNTLDSVAVKLEPATTEQCLKNHMRYIRRKLSSSTTAQACCKALRQGLLA